MATSGELSTLPWTGGKGLLMEKIAPSIQLIGHELIPGKNIVAFPLDWVTLGSIPELSESLYGFFLFFSLFFLYFSWLPYF